MDHKWYPCFAYAFKIGGGETEFSVRYDYVYAVDAKAARQTALDKCLSIHSPASGWSNHDVAVMDFPEFTIVKEGE